MPARGSKAWDLPALLVAADPRAGLAERNLWLVRLVEWLGHAAPGAEAGESRPALRLRHLLNVLDRHPEHRERVVALAGAFFAEVDTASLLADFGFTPRVDLFGELGQRLRMRLLPATPETNDLAELFGLAFHADDDALWLRAIDPPTLARLAALLEEAWRLGHPGEDWREPLLDAIMYLASAIRAGGFSGPMRLRMSPETLAGEPFRQLAIAADAVRERALAGHPPAAEAARMRALLGECLGAAKSVAEHLEQYGVSVDLVFQSHQLRRRVRRVEALLGCVESAAPARAVLELLASLVEVAAERRSVRALFTRHYALLAAKVTERSAETGEHYITRDRAEYTAMLRAAATGGAVLALTTHLKFLIVALGLAAFWSGFLAGINYAASFVVVHLLHGTVATKQPAMTAPAMARKLAAVSGAEVGDAEVERFVDEVAHLIRSQSAGILGNLIVVVPVVLALQLAWGLASEQPLVPRKDAEYVLHSLTLLGPTALYAAFTGVLLFASSLFAGWAENWFVWHRLDSALAWNPRLRAWLGPARAGRFSAWWREHVSGLAANVSLGLLLGVVPAIGVFFGLGLEVRHVTLSTGQLAAAVGTEGLSLLREAPFWWCAAGIAVTGVLNVGVSYTLAFRVALASQQVPGAGRGRINRAIRRRMLRRPLSFILPLAPR